MGLGFVYDVLALCYLGIVKVYLAPFICSSRYDVRTPTARRQVFGLPSQGLSHTSSGSARKMVRLTLQRAQYVVVTTEWMIHTPEKSGPTFPEMSSAWAESTPSSLSHADLRLKIS